MVRYSKEFIEAGFCTENCTTAADKLQFLLNGGQISAGEYIDAVDIYDCLASYGAMSAGEMNRLLGGDIAVVRASLALLKQYDLVVKAGGKWDAASDTN